MDKDELLDRHGNPVRVTRIPPRGQAKKLFKGRASYDNSISPFERFKDSNQCGAKCTSL